MNEKIFDILENSDDETVEKMEKRYPVLDEEKEKKLFEMSIEKMNKMKSSESDSSEGVKSEEIKIEGVEQYKRPVWHRAVGLVASVAIVAGGFALYKNRADIKDDLNPDVSTGTEATTEPSSENSVMEVAEEILINYEDFVNVYLIHDNADTDNYVDICGVNYYKFKDERFENIKELRAYGESVFEAQYFAENYNYFGGSYESNSLTPDYDPSYNFYDGFSLDGRVPVFVNVDGSLYTYMYNTEEEWINTDESLLALLLTDYTTEFSWSDDDAQVTVVDDDSFVVSKESVAVRNLITVTEKISLTVNKSDEGEWLIGNVEAEVLDEEKPTEAPQEYSELAEVVKELTDKYYELGDILSYGGISYDENDVIQFKPVPSQEDMQYIFTDEDYDRYLHNYEVDNVGMYCRVTDERFNSLENLENYARTIVTDKLYDEYFRNDLVDTLSGYNPGDTVESDKLSLYTMYNGELYLHVRVFSYGMAFDHWTDTPIKFYDVTENSFRVERDWLSLDSESEETLTGVEKMLGTYIYTDEFLFARDSQTGQWKIDLDESE